MSDTLSRYATRLVSSLPHAVEDAFLAATDPVGTFNTAKAQAERNLLNYFWTPGGGQRLKQDLRNQVSHRASSPEWWADATVDLASLLLAKKTPNFQLDDVAAAGKFGVQQAANGYGEAHAPVGTASLKRIEDGYNALKAQGEADPRTKQIAKNGAWKFLFGL